MIGKKPGSQIPLNGNNAGGMLVQNRDDDDQGVANGSSFTIKVSYGSNLLDITLPSTSTFGDVKKIIAQEIGVEPEMQKLFFRGKEKEDCDNLHMAGVKDNSKVVLLVEDTRDKATSSNEVDAIREISRGSEAVAEVRAEVDQLEEKVAALQAVVHGGTKIDERDIIYLTEMLMREMLKLDAIDAAGEGKVQRKMEVRRVQNFIDALDALKAINSNPFGDHSSKVSVTTEWEKFDSGHGSLTSPTPPPPTNVTPEREQFD